MEYREARETYGVDAFEAEMGAGAVRRALEAVDLNEQVEELQVAMTETRSKQNTQKTGQAHQAFQGFIASKTRPDWMILVVLPVIPPDLRPLVPLEVGALRLPI